MTPAMITSMTYWLYALKRISKKLCLDGLTLILCSVVFFPIAQAEPLANEADEARAQHLFTQVRCMVCHGESVADSAASFAEETRNLIRGRIKAGASNDAIITELRERFGDQIIMDPGWDLATYLLWIAPLLLLAFGVGRLYRYVRFVKISSW